MSYGSSGRSRDLMLDISRGKVAGHSTVVVRGHNPSQTSASGFVDIAEFGNLTYLATAETMNITSTSTDDDDGGAGLETILVQGVDNTGVAIQEIVTLNGTANVLTVNSYLRVNTMIGLSVGATAWNVGNVTAKASSAATTQCEMNATEGISQNSHYTVPLGSTLYVYRLEMNASKQAGGQAPNVEFKGYARAGGAGNCWVQNFDKRLDASVSIELDVDLPFPSTSAQAIGRTDIRFTSDTDQDSTETRTRFYGILIED